MKTLHLAAGIVALALLSGCGGSEEVANVAPTVQTDNGTELIVPAGNAVVENVAEANSSMAAAPALNLAPDGLTLVTASGSARQLAFDTPRAEALAMVSAAIGAPTGNSHNDECGGGPMDMADFRNGLTLFFLDGRFAGWDVDGREKNSFSTAAGIGTGSTLKQLRDVMVADVQNSSLGIEFNSGGLSGLLDANAPGGKITHIWAGNNCAFR